MMKDPTHFLLTLSFLLVFSTAAFGELPSRGYQILEQYQRERTKGLATLAERYLPLYEEELKRIMATGDLEKSVAIRAKIEELRETLQAASRMSEEVAETERESLLAGKTIFFKHDRHPEEVSFVFEEDGRAIWAFTGNESVPRQYKATSKSRQFLLWWPGHDKQPVWEINVAEDGKTATMRNTANDYTNEGRIEETE